MVTIDKYTGKWQAALQPPPRAPRAGSHVRIAWNPDGRELDDFRRCLNDGDLVVGCWVKTHPKLKADTYVIERRTYDRD